MRTTLGIFCVLGLSSCATVQQSLASHPWLEVRTQHFRLLTDAPEKAATKSVIELERYRRAMLLLWSAEANPADVSDVAMLRDSGDLFELAGDNVAGYFARNDFHQALVFSATQFGGMSSRTVLTHELAHMVTGLVAERPPAWVTEGLSEYLETMRIAESGEVTLGWANRNALSYLTNIGLMDLDMLWTWDPADRSELGQYYAAAWVLVHYLITEKPQQFSVLMKELSAGRDGKAAWATAFGDVPLSSYWHAVRHYAARLQWQLLSFRMPPVSTETTVRRLSPGEAQATVAWLTAMARRQTKLSTRAAAVKQALDLAEKLDPAAPLVKEMSALRAELDRVERLRARETAAAAAPAVCPDDVARGDSLSPGDWAPRTMVKEFAPLMLQELDQGARGVSDRRTFELAAGEVQISGGSPGGSPALVILRRAGPAGCVVNGWHDRTVQSRAMNIVTWWAARDLSQLLVLLSFEVPATDGPAGTKWLALATDGKRAWWAARGRDGNPKLGGANPRLRRAGGKMQLELTEPGGGSSLFPLDVAGEFGTAKEVPLPPG